MVYFCAVKECKRESYPGCGISFHRLPTNEDLKNKWIKALQVRVTKHSVVCGLHFNDEDYVTQAKKRLKHGAIPTILPQKNTSAAEDSSDDNSLKEVYISDQDSIPDIPEKAFHKERIVKINAEDYKEAEKKLKHEEIPTILPERNLLAANDATDDDSDYLYISDQDCIFPELNASAAEDSTDDNSLKEVYVPDPDSIPDIPKKAFHKEKNIKINAEDFTTEEFPTILSQKNTSAEEDTSDDSSLEDDYISDQNSVIDTPREAYLKKKMIKIIQAKKKLLIQNNNMIQQNNMLKNKCISLQKEVQELKHKLRLNSNKVK